MALQVIGAGFGRTGTMSLKLALELLGLGPCYHMVELIKQPARAAHWNAIIDGAAPDWDAIFAGYGSTCDWPSTSYFRQIHAFYPRAKVVLTRRDPDAWYESIRKTILEIHTRQPAEDRAEQRRMVDALVMRGTFDGRLADRQHALAVLRAHEADVIASVPADSLLVYDVAEGWDPLCRFLGVPQPQSPFPHVNSTQEFRSRAGLDGQ